MPQFRVQMTIEEWFHVPSYLHQKAGTFGFVDGHVRFSKIYYDGYSPAYTRDPIPGYDYKYSGK